MNSENIFKNSIFYGKVLHKRYKYDYIDSLSKLESIQSYGVEFAREEIHNCDMMIRPLDVGNSVYIENLDVETVIEGVLRDVEGVTIYYTDYVIEMVEDIETDRSLAIALNNREQGEM